MNVIIGPPGEPSQGDPADTGGPLFSKDGIPLNAYRWNCDYCGEEQDACWPRIQVGPATVCWECPWKILTDNEDRYGNYFPIYVAERFERLKKRHRASTPKQLRLAVLAKYKFTCAECGSTKQPEVDHIKPVSKGGKDKPSNLQVLCKPCNVRKGNKVKKDRESVCGSALTNSSQPVTNTRA